MAGEPTRLLTFWRGLLVLASVGLLAVTIAGSAGPWHWLLDLTSHFRMHYLAAATVVVALAAVAASRTALALAVAALVWNGWLIAPYYLGQGALASRDAAIDAPAVKVIALNVLTSNPHKARVVDYLRRQSADIVGLSEIDERWRHALEELADIYPHRLYEPRSDNFGIALFSKLPWQSARVLRHRASGVPSIIAHIGRQGTDVLLVVTHPPPPMGPHYTAMRDADLAETAELCVSQPVPCMIIGDLNATPWSSAFRHLVQRARVRDSALGHGIQTTWNAQSPLIRIPIDHILVPATASVETRRIGPELGSDHLPVEVVVRIRPSQPPHLPQHRSQ